MMCRMDVVNISQAGNTLSLYMKHAHPFEKTLANLQTDKYICGALYTEFQLTSYSSDTYDDSEYYISVSVKFRKVLAGDDSTYTCKFSSKNVCTLLVNELRVHDDQWYQILHVSDCKSKSNSHVKTLINVIIHCEIFERQCIFASLYNDTLSDDFKLCGVDGSVATHKTILAAYSPVFKRMLEGEWKESNEGRVSLQGVSLETLQHLKDYMYLNKLPDTGLQELCLLGSCYMMPNLVVHCCAKLLNKLTADNVMEVFEFALRNKLMPLHAPILRKINKTTIDKLEACSNWPWSTDICKSDNLEK